MLAIRQCLSWHVPSMARRIIRASCSGAIAQCLNLEHEFHHIASKLCILGFEPRKESPLIKPRDFRIPQWQSRSFEGMSIRTASQSPSTFTGKLQAQYMTHEPSSDPHPSPRPVVRWYLCPPECSRSPPYERKEAPRWRG